MHKQGYHWSPAHDEYRGRILEHIRRIRPAFGIVMTEDWTPLQEAYTAHPHAICARVWAIDDGRSDSDPLGAYRLLRDDPDAAAQQLMQRYLDKRSEWRAHGLSIPDERLFGHAWNEANAMAPYPAIIAGTKALLRLAIRHNFPFAVIAESVGNPHGLHADGTPDWGVYDDRELESLINDSGSVADIRGYWQAEGPLHSWTDETGKLREDYPHLAGRHHGWPLDTPIVIGECGVDGTIFNRNDAWGFANYGISAPDYSRQQKQNHDKLDSRVLSQCPWQLDYADRKWGGYNYVGALDHIEQWVAQTPETPHTVHIPALVVQPDPPQAAPEPEEQAMSVLDPAVMMAILDVESGAAFGDGGRLVIRFEAHVFRDRLRNKFHDQLRSDVLFSAHFQIADSQPWAAPQYARESESSPWWAIHTGSQADEWRAFELAGRIDYRAAVESISMGRPQLMGFNHARVGYPTAEAMFAAFARRQDGEAAQIIAMLNYMLTDAALVRAIKERDWREIARRYNGAGSVDVYTPLLEAAWRKRAGS